MHGTPAERDRDKQSEREREYNRENWWDTRNAHSPNYMLEYCHEKLRFVCLFNKLFQKWSEVGGGTGTKNALMEVNVLG